MTETPHFPPQPPRHIECLAYDRMQLLDVAGPMQVFATANDLRRKAGDPPAYSLALVGLAALTATSSGLALATRPLPPVEAPLDTLLLPGGDGVLEACRTPALLDWLQRRAPAARRLAAICSGAYLPATLGLLDERRAVTHWNRCRDFAARFPAVRLDPDPIFVRDGPIWTSAGITAGIDLALAFVEEDLGGAMALAVARQLVVFLKRPGGQSQFSAALSLEGGGFDALHAAIAEHPARDWSVAAMAAFMGMSERSLMRAYGRATATTPARAVERLRLEAARRLLEAGHPIKRVAARCGFGSEESLRRVFLKRLGVTPSDYRARFRTGEPGISRGN